jgi:hypothetical protein
MKEKGLENPNPSLRGIPLPHKFHLSLFRKQDYFAILMLGKASNAKL